MKLSFLFVVLVLCTRAVWAAPPPDGAARDFDALRTFPVDTVGVHVSGGIKGGDDWVIIDLRTGDVRVLRSRQKRQYRITAAERNRLVKDVTRSGFFTWNREYLPSGRGADRMTTEIVFHDARRQHSVVCTSGAAPPPGFDALARRLSLLGYVPYSYGPSYQWVAGRLEHMDLEGGFWRVVYAQDSHGGTGPGGPGTTQTDAHGGRFVLEIAPQQLRGYKSGDLVLLTGAVQADQMGIHMAGTYYRVSTIERLRP